MCLFVRWLLASPGKLYYVAVRVTDANKSQKERIPDKIKEHNLPSIEFHVSLDRTVYDDGHNNGELESLKQALGVDCQKYDQCNAASIK